MLYACMHRNIPLIWINLILGYKPFVKKKKNQSFTQIDTHITKQ